MSLVKDKMTRNLIGLSFLLLFSEIAISQNLILNPSFEEVNEITTEWSGTFSEFNRRIKHWNSPTQGSPDILFEKALDKMYPKRAKVNLSEHRPRTGKFMIGIKTYGCETNPMHCQEYIQIKLTDSLRQGEKYFFEYWVSPVSTSVKVNSFGVALGLERKKELYKDGLIDMLPVSMQKKIIDDDSIMWHKISGTFESDANYKYIVIGNFGPDELVKFKKEENGLEYGYYLLDDVILRPAEQKIQPKFTVNETLVLENILFEFDKAALLENSKPKLDKLIEFLNSNNKYSIDIMGHTDEMGSKAHNLKLSQKRANSIKLYLIENSINASRINAIGMGSEYPIAANDSEKNRKQNRRVEININEK